MEIEDGTFTANTDLLPNNTYAVGTNASLICDEGFHISGFARIQIQTVSCEENGVWVPPVRKCISDDNGELI